MRKYFGTDGIRGIANIELTPELAYKVGKAGAYVLSREVNNKRPTILIGKDTRVSGDMIESAMVAGFCGGGANVKILGVVPTPAVSYLIRKYNADGGVVISASHNPYEFNGIKIFSKNGTKISDENEEKIEKIIESDIELNSLSKSYENIGTYERTDDMIEHYTDFLKDSIHIDNITNLKIGLDAANGATYKTAGLVFDKLGIDYEIINSNPNGININDNCGSTHVESLQKLVVDNKLSLGLAFDGDGDRCLAVDELGNLVDGDKILAIISGYLVEKGQLKNNTVVATVMSNLGLDKYAMDNNINVVKTKVGDRYVLEEMQKNGYNFGGEQSGHIIFLDCNPTGDGILTGLKLVEVVSAKNKTLSELANNMKSYPQVIINAKVSNSKKYGYQEDELIKDEIKNLEDKFENNGRVLIRTSGTEPLVRVMIEGEDLEYITKEAKRIANLIEERLK